jgi:hypothetical protein
MSEEIKKIPADLEPELANKTVVSGVMKNKNIKMIAGSMLALLIVVSAAYVGLTGKSGLFKGNLLDGYTRQNDIVLSPVFENVFIGKNDDPRANKILLNIEYDLFNSFLNSDSAIGEINNTGGPSNTFAPITGSDETETPVKPTPPVKTTNNTKPTITSPNIAQENSIDLVQSKATLDAKVCVHDSEVAADETEVPAGKLLNCYDLASEFKTVDPIDTVLVVNIDDLATTLDGNYAVTVFISSDENKSYAIGTTNISTTNVPSSYYELELNETSVEFDEELTVDISSTLTGSQLDSLSMFDLKASHKITRNDDSFISRVPISINKIFNLRSDKVIFSDTDYTPGELNVGLNVDLTVGSSTVDPEDIFRLEGAPVSVKLRPISQDTSGAFCSNISVIMTEPFPQKPTVGTEIFQKYTIKNTSDSDINVGLVSSDNGFQFTDNSIQSITSTDINARSSNAINLSLLPSAAQTYVTDVSFVPVSTDTGWQCQPINSTAKVAVISSVETINDEILSCDLDTNLESYNPLKQNVEFLVDSTGSPSDLVAGFRVEIKNSSNELVATLKQQDVALPILDYNPANGNLDWDAQDSTGDLMPDGTYIANLIVSLDDKPTACKDSTKFVLRTINEQNNEQDDDGVSVTTTNEPIVQNQILDDLERIYNPPYFERNDYYVPNFPDTPYVPDVPSTPESSSGPYTPPTTTNTPDLGFNEGAASIAGQTGPGALVYPLMFMGSALIARRRKNR